MVTCCGPLTMYSGEEGSFFQRSVPQRSGFRVKQCSCILWAMASSLTSAGRDDQQTAGSSQVSANTVTIKKRSTLSSVLTKDHFSCD